MVAPLYRNHGRLAICSVPVFDRAPAGYVPTAVIKYIGSKRVLLPHIVQTLGDLPQVRSVLDLFSGTSRVGHALKRAGYRVTANDHNAYAHTLARCYVGADRERVLSDVEKVLADLRRVRPSPGFFTETYCEKSRFFHPKNGARIDAMREAIARMDLREDVEAVVLVSLMEAADRVDSTCGLQMAYLKKWAPRAHNDLELRVPDILNGEGRALGMDALDAVQQGSWDLVYMDPPYNQHKYLSNYHVWETLVRWDRPEVYGRAMKRVDCREYHSPFNSKGRIAQAMRDLVSSIEAPYLLVSFNSEGYLSYEELMEILGERGEVTSATHEYKRYVGAQIGIYNPSGDKVGQVSHLKNHEHLFLVERA
jgi:adenine-specific DNA-methyltransferase